MALYLVGTPIGNLKDITLRALEILKTTPVLAVEKWSDSRKLLQAYEIKPERIINFDDLNAKRVLPKILEILIAGQDVALITSAGMPGISDPGAYLVNEARKKDVEIIPIPGPSALTTAIAVSGFIGPFWFVEFLPKKSGQLKKIFQTAHNIKSDLVFFESTYRLEKTLKFIADKYPETRIFIGKEMTKKFEQYWIGKATEALDRISQNKNFTKGEFTLIVSFA